MEDVLSIEGVQRGRVRVVEHEGRDRAQAGALLGVAHQHEVAAAAGELRVEELNGENRPDRRLINLDPVDVSAGSVLAPWVERLSALVVLGTTRHAFPGDALR